MTEGDDLKMSRAEFEKAVRKVLAAPSRPSSKKAKKPTKKPRRAKADV
jgi:hypothetical protein